MTRDEETIKLLEDTAESLEVLSDIFPEIPLRGMLDGVFVLEGGLDKMIEKLQGRALSLRSLVPHDNTHAVHPDACAICFGPLCRVSNCELGAKTDEDYRRICHACQRQLKRDSECVD